MDNKQPPDTIAGVQDTGGEKSLATPIFPNSPSPPGNQKTSRTSLRKKVGFALLAALIVVGGSIAILRGQSYNGNSGNSSAVVNIDPIDLPLEDLVSVSQLGLGTGQTLSVNGQLRANNSLVIAPTAQTGDPSKGYLYYDQVTNQLAYFNGTEFVTLGKSEVTPAQIAALQSQIVAVSGQVPEIPEFPELPADLASTTSANTFTALNTFSSGINASSLTVTGSSTMGPTTMSSLLLNSPLSVASGGTGVTSLTVNGVLIGQGSGAVTTVATSTPGECLISTAGAPIWTNCAGAAVATLQQAYTASVGGTTPEIRLDVTRGGLDIQDANATLGAALFNVRASNAGGLGTSMFSIGNTGAILAQNSADSATAFRVQNAAGTTTAINVDTTATNRITFGTNTDLVMQGASAYITNSQGVPRGEAFGDGATTSNDSVAVGYNASNGVAADQNVAIGSGAINNSSGSVAIGYNADSGFVAVAVGAGSEAAQASVAAGNSAYASNHRSVAIGASAFTADVQGIAIGNAATTTGAAQMVIGGSTANNGYITEGYFGSGVTDATPQNFVLQGTGGSGNNVQGASFTLAGGRGTGTGNGGNLNFQVAAPGGAGASLNSLATVASLSGINGAALFQNSVDSAAAFRIQNAAGTNTALNVDTTATNAITLGTNTDLILQGATAYISNTQTQNRSEAFGAGATVASNDSLAVGYNSVGQNQSVAIGPEAVNNSTGSVAIGYSASSNFGGSVAIGHESDANDQSIAIGGSATVLSDRSIALGVGSVVDAAHHNSIALGYSAATSGTAQLVVGGSTASDGYVNQGYFGSGVTDATPQNFVLQGTGGSGNNIQGASFTLAGGRGTGTGNGGNLNFQIADPAGAGSTLNPLSTVASLSGVNGAALFQNSTNSLTAFRIQNAAGSSTVFDVDTSNNRVGILTSAPRADLDLGRDNASLYIGQDTTGGRIGFGDNPLEEGLSFENGAFNYYTGQLGGMNFYTDYDNETTTPEFSLGNGGEANFRTASDNNNAFLIQDANGSALFNLDSFENGADSNFIINPSFEADPLSNWTYTGTAGGAITRVTNSGAAFYGSAGLKIDTNGGADDGAMQTLSSTLNASTTYVIQFEATGSGLTTVTADYSYDGSNWSNCTGQNSGVSSTVTWGRIYCSFTTGSGGTAPTASNAIRIKQGTAATTSFWIDAVKLNNNFFNTPYPYSVANLVHDGLTWNGPLVVQTGRTNRALQVVGYNGVTVFDVDSVSGYVGIGTERPTTTLDIDNGALRIGGTLQTNYVSPLGSSIATKINVPNFDPGAFGQIMAMGVPATNCTGVTSTSCSARVLTLLDARTLAHQPTLAVLSPNEIQVGGFSWDGSNTNLRVKNSSSQISLNGGGVDMFSVRDVGAGNEVIADLGVGSSRTGQLALWNKTNNNWAMLQAGTTSTSYITTLPTARGNTGDCLSVTNTSGIIQDLGYASCLSGSSGIQNTTTLQTNANIAISSATNSDTTLFIKQKSGQTGDLINVQESGGTGTLFSINQFGQGGVSNSFGVGTVLGVGMPASTTAAVRINTNGDPARFGLEVSGTTNQTADIARFYANNDAGMYYDANGKLSLQGAGSAIELNEGYINTPFGGYGQYSNLLTHTEEFEHVDWDKTIATPTANTIVAPNGQTVAEVLDSDVNGEYARGTSFTNATNDNYTFSVWLKTASGTQNADLRVDGGISGTGTAKTVTVYPEWSRYFVTQNTNLFSGFLEPVIFPGGTGGTGTVHAWGAQLVKASEPLVYARNENGTLAGNYSGSVTNGLIMTTGPQAGIALQARDNSGSIFELYGGALGDLTFYNSDGGGILGTMSSGGALGLGLNNTSPAARLHVADDSTDELFKLTDTTGTDADVFTVEDGGNATFRTQSASDSAFQIQNAQGVDLLRLSNDWNGYTSIDNADFENNPLTGWTYTGTAGGAVSRSTDTHYYGEASLKIDTNGGADDGAKHTLAWTATPATDYVLSWYAKADSWPYTAPIAAYSYDGSDQSDCTDITNTTIDSNGMTRYSCVFTTGSGPTAPTASNAIIIKQVAADTQTFYIDNIRITGYFGTSPWFVPGHLKVDPIITSPVIVIPEVDSTTAFQIRSGVFNSPVLNVDSMNSFVGIRTENPQAPLDVNGQTIMRGTSDNEELIIKKFSSQALNKPQLVIQNSAGAERARINATENFDLFMGAGAGGAISGGGGFNVGIGTGVLDSTTTGSANIAIGNALGDNVTGNDNIAMGYAAGEGILGSTNVAIGKEAMRDVGDVNGNIAIGTQAGNVSGAGISFYNNLFLGPSAGYYDSGINFHGTAMTSLQNAAAIGANALVHQNNSIVLGSVDNNTKVGIGTTKPDNMFSVSPRYYDTGTASQSGTTITGTGTTWTPAMVGMRFVYADGTDAGFITGFGSATSLTVDTSLTVSPAQHYRIHVGGFNVTDDGEAYIQSDSTAAFKVQNAAGNKLFNVNTTNNVVTVGGKSATISPVNVWQANGTNRTTLDVSPSAVGNVLVFAMYGDTSTVASISGGGVTSWNKVTSGTGVNLNMYYGRVTSTGASTITISYNTNPGTTTELVAGELSSALGSSTAWVVGQSGTRSNSGTTVTYPSLTSPTAGSAFFGYTYDSSFPAAGSDPGFTYTATSMANMYIYNTSLAEGTTYTPTHTQAGGGASYTIGAIFSAYPTAEVVITNGSSAYNGEVTVNGNLTIGAGRSLTVLGGSGTFPGSPAEGQIYYRTENDQLYVYTGSKWQADRSTATKIVATADSQNKEKADYVGDGTNDEVEIEAAIAALPATGGKVVLLDGNYSIGADITINKDLVQLSGSGANTMLHKAWNQTSAGAGVITISASAVLVSELAIDGHRGTYGNANNHGIYEGNGEQEANINSVWLDELAGDGIFIDGTDNVSYNNRVTNSSFTDITWNAIEVKNANDSVVSNNNVNNASNIGIQIESATQVSISANTVENSTKGIGLLSATRVAVTGNAIYDNGTGISTHVWGITVTGNVIAGNVDGVSIEAGSDQTNISANQIIDSGDDGIFSVSGSGITGVNINDNNIGFNGGRGILLGSNVTNSMITSNRIDGNTGSSAESSIETNDADDIDIVGNKITDTAGTGYAILVPSGSANTYLADNTFSGTGAASISDASTSTKYANQLNASGRFVNTNIFIEDKLALGVDARTIADEGTGGNATLTLTPNSSYVKITCNDTQGCDITMGEGAGVAEGDIMVAVTDTGNVNWADTGGVSELNAAFNSQQYDSISLLYITDRWVETARSNN